MINVQNFTKEFDKRHEDKHGFVCDDYWVYYSDGAKRHKNPLGVLLEPPDNERERSENIIRFWQLKQSLGVEEFETKKKELLDEANFACIHGGVPSFTHEEAMRALKNIKNKVSYAQDRIDELTPKPTEKEHRENQLLEQLHAINRTNATKTIEALKNEKI